MELRNIIEIASTGLDAIKRAPIVNRDSGIKCLRIGDISQKKRYVEWGFTEVSQENYKKFQLKKGDIIIARTGATVGVNKYIANDLKSVYNNGLIRLRVKNGNNPMYAYYLMQSTQFKNYINSIAFGTSAQPNIQINDLLSFEIPIIDFKIQAKIAKILSSIDKKIEINNELNENLQKLSQELYKRWFVDFEFPDEKGLPYRSSGGEMIDSEIGEIPRGWEVRELKNFFPVLTGKKDANASSPNGLYPFFTCSQSISKIDSYSFDAEAILLSGNGDFNVKFFRGKFDAYQRTYVLVPKDGKLLGYLYQSIVYNLNNITSGHRGSVIKFITKGSIEDFKIPFKEDLKIFPILKQLLLNIESRNKENERLIELRSALLPKLMNGEIDLDKIDL